MTDGESMLEELRLSLVRCPAQKSTNERINRSRGPRGIKMESWLAVARSAVSFVVESHMMCRVLVAIPLLLLCIGCSRRGGSSSNSVDDARSRGILVAEYAIADNAKLGPYTPLEVWIEDERKLVVRLKGPHVDTEPRVNIQGLTDLDYRSIWSERDGPPYEVWLAPDPIPDSLVLQRGEESTVVQIRDD